MQQYPLLQTKLYLPAIRPDPSTRPAGVRARLISRPRLIERLNAGRSSPRVDQAALHSLLASIRDSGLALIPVTQNSPNTEKACRQWKTHRGSSASF
jgi:hypothetical protein